MDFSLAYHGPAFLRNRRLWLAVLLVWLGAYHATVALTALGELRSGQTLPGLPVRFGFEVPTVSDLTNDAYDAGVRPGDFVETIDGKPFDSMRVFYEAVNRRKPGDLLPVTVRSAKGTPFAVEIHIPPLNSEEPTAIDWLGQTILVVVLPLLCLALGFGVAFLRPNCRLAWLLLSIMIGFAGWAQDFPIAQWPSQFPMLAFWSLFERPVGLWSAWLILFAIWFPASARPNRRLFLFKYLLLVPWALLTLLFSAFTVGREFSFSKVEQLRPLVTPALAIRPGLAMPFVAVWVFLVVIAMKSVTIRSADGRRRLRILLLGSVLSFAPLLAEATRAFARRSSVSEWAGPLEFMVVLLPLGLFPLVLSYALLVRRAFDVPTTLRQAIHYIVVGRGLTVVQALVAAAAVLFPTDSLWTRCEIAAASFLLILLLRPGVFRLAHWLDRFVFREALSREQELHELAASLRTLLDESTLLQTTVQKLSSALQASEVTFLANAAGTLTAVFSTADPPSASFTLEENSGVVRHCKLYPKVAAIYFDDAKNWIQTVHPSEQEAIKRAQVQVLMPLAAKDKLLGALVLGPRKEDAPYTARELQLLDAVATQAGFALENSRLAHQIEQERTR